MSVLGPCRATGGEHEWQEGGVRDTGRYHCARCYTHLSPMRAVQELRAAARWTAIVEKARAACLAAQQGHDDADVDPYDIRITIAGNRFTTGEVLRMLEHLESEYAGR